jgi:ketosteroid isomerase-like protein
MDRAAVEEWVAGYERAWRTADTELLNELFTPDASYLRSPWADPIVGSAALARFWEAEREGPDEEFTMSSDVVAVEGVTAVVRVFVEYGPPDPSSWRDLWVLMFEKNGRCTRFEEWPFAPQRA